ncbi:MAG: hypothetical protein GX254_07520 [Clostridiales bacterium]|nr:hypothetical protein [Clostridiales bacterium]
MAYCVNCGVELGESEKACPLCNTKVYHPKHRPNPDAAPYPGDHCVSEQKVSRGGVILIITLVFLLPTSIVAMADVSINFKITWSGYVLGAFAFLYLAVVPPLASKKERPVLFIVLDAVCLGLYLLYIEKKTGDIWFSSLALYIIAGITAAVSILLSLARRKKLLGLRLFAFSLFAAALLPVLIEWRINVTFRLRSFLSWSLYPFVVSIILGAICLVIDKNEPLKEKLARKFFL